MLDSKIPLELNVSVMYSVDLCVGKMFEALASAVISCVPRRGAGKSAGLGANTWATTMGALKFTSMPVSSKEAVLFTD